MGNFGAISILHFGEATTRLPGRARDTFVFLPIYYSPVWIHMACHSIIGSHKGPQNHSRTTSSICRWGNWRPCRLNLAQFNICGWAGCELHNFEGAVNAGSMWMAPAGIVPFYHPISFYCEEKMISCCFEWKMCINFKYLSTDYLKKISMALQSMILTFLKHLLFLFSFWKSVFHCSSKFRLGNQRRNVIWSLISCDLRQVASASLVSGSSFVMWT